MDPYSPVKPLPVLAAELGIDVKDLAKLDANENLYGPIQEVGHDISHRIPAHSTR